MATYDLTNSIPSKIKTGDILNCPYSGSAKSITLPKGEYKLEVWGAEGGYRSSNTYSGKGAYSKGTLTISDKNTTLYLYSGGAGNTAPGTATIKTGGFNGGGYRYSYNGGGGGSDIRIGSDSLYARVIVAGGGGSDGAASYKGGNAGTDAGERGTFGCGSYGYGGTKNSSTTTGSGLSYIVTQDTTSNSSSACAAGFGFGGFGVYRSSGYGGAGGGGWYGGEGTYPDGSVDDDGGGGGGSSYVYTASTAANYPSGCLLNSSYYLEDVQTIAGNTSFTSPSGTAETGHTGDGYCRITVLNARSFTPMFVKIENEKQVPEEYEKLAFLKSSGTQFIDTGLILNNYTNFYIKGKVSNNDAAYFFGTYETGRRFLIQRRSMYFYNTDNAYLSQESQDIPAFISFECNYENGTLYWIVNGETVSQSTNLVLPLETSRLFKAVGDNYNSRGCSIFEFSFSTDKNSPNIRDFVPVRRKSDSVLGMYDLINNKFYINSGDGEFEAGSFWRPVSQIFYKNNGEWQSGSWII